MADPNSLSGYSEGGDDGDYQQQPQQRQKSTKSVPYDFTAKTALEPQMCDLTVEQLQVGFVLFFVFCFLFFCFLFFVFCFLFFVFCFLFFVFLFFVFVFLREKQKIVSF